MFSLFNTPHIHNRLEQQTQNRKCPTFVVCYIGNFELVFLRCFSLFALKLLACLVVWMDCWLVGWSVGRITPPSTLYIFILSRREHHICLMVYCAYIYIYCYCYYPFGSTETHWIFAPFSLPFTIPNVGFIGFFFSLFSLLWATHSIYLSPLQLLPYRIYSHRRAYFSSINKYHSINVHNESNETT